MKKLTSKNLSYDEIKVAQRNGLLSLYDEYASKTVKDLEIFNELSVENVINYVSKQLRFIIDRIKDNDEQVDALAGVIKGLNRLNWRNANNKLSKIFADAYYKAMDDYYDYIANNLGKDFARRYALILD